ncbi:MAG: PorT family protein [Saprospiraceae bacterium]|nr:PorT family protein [Saprospiraceae bacterium]
MDSFEQQFRDHWNNREEPEFHEGDWKLLQGQLHGKTSRRLPGWLLLLLPWLGIGGLLYLLLHMHHQLDALQTRQLTPLMITDTLVQIQEWITHDTVHVYHTVIHRDTLFIQNQAYVSAEPTANPGSQLDYLQSNPAPGPAVLHDGLSSAILPTTPTEPLSDQEWRTLAMLPSDLTGPVRSTSFISKIIPAQKMEVDHTPRVNRLRKTIYQVRPTGLAISGEGAGLIPVENGIHQSSGYSFGLRGSLLYGDHWQVGMGASFNQLNFEVHAFDAVLGVPAVDPPSEGFDFVTAEVLRPFIALDLQGRYALSERNRLSPFFEGGLQAILTQPFEVLYDFHNANTGVTWTYETSPSGEFHLPVQAIFGAGLKYRLGAIWSLGLHGQYVHNLAKKNAVPDHMKAGAFLQYSF